MKAKNTQPSISENLTQLEELLNWFESGEVTVETALEKYQQAAELSKTLETQLKEAKNQIEVIKKQFSA